MVTDSLGDGIKIDFPVVVRLFQSWSPKNDTLTGESIYLSLGIDLRHLAFLFTKQHVA